MSTNHYFWAWFYDNQKNLFNWSNLSKKLQSHYLFWLEWHLNNYSKGVSYVLVFPKKKNKKMQLIITANGKPKYFKKVEQLVKEAPSLKNWKITAFVEPTADFEEIIDGTDDPYTFQDISLKASEVKFEAIEYDDSKKIDLIIYLKYHSISDDYENLMQLVYHMIESMLGEKFLYENIRFIRLDQMPDEEDDAILELYQLKSFIDCINAERT